MVVVGDVLLGFSWVASSANLRRVCNKLNNKIIINYNLCESSCARIIHRHCANHVPKNNNCANHLVHESSVARIILLPNERPFSSTCLVSRECWCNWSGVTGSGYRPCRVYLWAIAHARNQYSKHPVLSLLMFWNLVLLDIDIGHCLV